MENISPTIPVLETPIISSPSMPPSFFSKIFEYKYLILLIIIVAILSYYYYNYYYKPKQQEKSTTSTKPKLQDFIVADMNGKVIKILGEQIGELKVPQIEKQQVINQVNSKSQVKSKSQPIYEESSDENNNIKQHDLTNSEMIEITNKLKN